SMQINQPCLEMSQEHPNQALSLGNLTIFFHFCFEQLGVLSDLDKVLSIQHNALKLCPQGYSHQAISLSNLVYYFYSHFKQLSMLSDINE
ncbi:hypothetical protein HD554DRAFT_2025259, partial [Boletus coccyginus]